MTAYERRSSPLFWRPDTHQVDIPKGGMVSGTPANKLVQAAKPVGNQVWMTVVVFGVIEGNSHDRASRHLGDRAACGQMITKRSLGNNDVDGRFRQHPYRAGYAYKKDR